MKRTISVIAILGVLGLVLGGCASPEQRAQKLFEKGKYEEIMAKYPDQPIAKEAKCKVAERMLAEGKYYEILADYADTPSANDAVNKIAERMFDEKKFDEVIAKYPNTPAANMARNVLAEQLYADKKIDELVAKYPHTEAGRKACDDLAKVEFDKIMKKSKKARMKGLEEFLKNPTYVYTETAITAREEVAKLTPKKAGHVSGQEAHKTLISSGNNVGYIGYGTPADDVVRTRGSCDYTEVLGSDDNGLIVAWHYPDVTYVMKRSTRNGIECYRVAEKRHK